MFTPFPFAKLFKKFQHRKEEVEQIEKIKSAKTGEPITLTGYVAYDKDGNDTGKRFVCKEDAEEYAKLIKEAE